MLPDHLKDARLASLSILAKHYREEASELASAEIARQGLAPEHPFYGRSYVDKFDQVADAVHRGLLHAPVTPEVAALLEMPSEPFVRITAQDATTQEDRCVELRHPLLLRGWSEALNHLWGQHSALSGLESGVTVDLPALDKKVLDGMPTEEAWKLINRRRFLRVLAQRHRECEMHIREVVRATAVRRDEVEAPWRSAVADSREELGRRYPEQLQVLTAAFAPFCVPGTTEILREKRSRPVAKELIPLLKQALVDGTWRRLSVISAA